MAYDFEIGAGATLPALRYALKHNNTLTNRDLTGAVVRFELKPRSGGDVVIRSGSVESNETKVVRLDWVADWTSTPGEFYVRIKVTYSDGAVEYFPATWDRLIRIY